MSYLTAQAALRKSGRLAKEDDPTLFLRVDAQRFSYPPHLAEVNGAMGATLLE
jgi:hypothetical protein